MTTKEYGIGQYIVNEIHLYDTKLKDDNSAPSASSIDGVPSFNSQSSSFNSKDTTSSPNIQEEGGEVSISSHRIKKEERVKEKMHNDNVVHLKETLLDSEVRLTKPLCEGSDLVPTPSVVSNNKDTSSSPNMQGEDTKFSISESSVPFSTTEAGEIAEQCA